MSGVSPHSEPAVNADLIALRAMLERFFAAKPVRLYLFGSAARGELWRGSDIDIAVLPLGTLPEGWQAELRERLEESNLLCRVDLVDLTETSPEFAQRVMAEGTLWIA